MKPLFFTITGCDFARSIKWARTAPRLRDLALAAAKKRKSA